MANVKQLIAASNAELSFRYGPAQWELVRIFPGEFIMGSAPDEPGRESSEAPGVRVRITRPFYIGRYQITQPQYRAVMDENPSHVKGDDLPVDQVRYSDALEFCNRLSGLLDVKVGLPTEAQWEYACRASTATPYYSGATDADLDKIAWYRGNAGKTVHPVGKKQPNAWGLFDMLGNLWEPCADEILRFPTPGTADPEGKRFPSYGAARGGAWVEPAGRCRAATRIQTDDNLAPIGIRVVINP
jgi:formylglycine-generating enzyme required for sulfatase activity